ncbi:hypothetical protein COCC4DRAFT_76898 [Bipolaris maydis ATCC 48331]|uniref:Uncharacterized protein n=2 Tax=Cochliobolus heterostrophus TaxID=5016 RepID=M2SHR8_COCH5|nr:uncharacterized protein COCC4DRAFT_76898 [Bipolaris maydis ATCC 48331]EMD84925.1 hypothetical protein COCHEDRAFT_1208185 [Bipolaris maydis C5]KAJ5025777.1 hypothetical protein J3E73DRAFT_320489 [Bipolaris maydis]ENH98852.1 hypothetical protein COCC4DRAFT_76898 [Bipolaris maydis ATCC 48331]KAJ5064390.1 hypothetical protein J3E74DRAFT_415440 [Bipolaris maydis]KAJ6196466.1 hypothetical protein J3E72DRAFT_385938 [Bipolaris maydis]
MQTYFYLIALLASGALAAPGEGRNYIDEVEGPAVKRGGYPDGLNVDAKLPTTDEDKLVRRVGGPAVKRGGYPDGLNVDAKLPTTDEDKLV